MFFWNSKVSKNSQNRRKKDLIGYANIPTKINHSIAIKRGICTIYNSN